MRRRPWACDLRPPRDIRPKGRGCALKRMTPSGSNSRIDDRSTPRPWPARRGRRHKFRRPCAPCLIGSRQRQTHGAVRIGGRQHRRGTPVSDRGRKAGSAKAQSSSHRKYSQRPGGNSPSEDRQIGAFPDGTFHPAGRDSTPWPLASAPGSPRALPRRQTAGPGSVLPGMQRAADLSPNGIRCPARTERWDYYESRGCRPFKYRHRTRLLVAARLG